ncbi:histidine decarboxylase [Verticillium alfalfae VaMs.102]|uniref:Histidine decarboxylase n=1 Tax=Verticillium alfalfae (strain VaMs.102 / ATCC MYA-4576 / FGSC 10136) TaxID=526221 RepID=C9STQ2_VERA1|nr:histidine decarboxylase [Verticillium alfalfae VaMs.102]EEY22213.1 histidine decarboxylase [Verticillium alfalfae VaMs.102]
MPFSCGIDFSKPADKGEFEDVFAETIGQWDKTIRKAVGYPRNWIRHPKIQELMKTAADYGVHNVGNWAEGGRFAPEAFCYEFEVMLFFMELFHCAGGEDNYWGYIDASGQQRGTSGRRRNGLRAQTIDENDDGSIDMAALREAFEKNDDHPIWMGILCGGTVKEGRDNIRQILELARDSGRPRSDFFFHVDGAFSAVPLALMSDADDVDIVPSFELDVDGFGIDTLNVSTHKFIGTLDTGGMILMRREHSEAVAVDVEYIQSVHKTQIGSRNARAILECWMLIKYVGRDTFTEWAFACAQRARKLKKEMATVGAEDILLNHNAMTVYCKEFSPQVSKEFYLAPQKGYVHAIVTPHTLHPSELGTNREGEPFEGFDTANRFVEAVGEAMDHEARRESV